MKPAKSLFTGIVASVLLMALVLVGCQSPEEKTIKIGFIGPLTGDVKTFGESTRNGFQMALDKHNSTAGGYKIVPVIADDRNDPTEAVSTATWEYTSLVTKSAQVSACVVPPPGPSRRSALAAPAGF